MLQDERYKIIIDHLKLHNIAKISELVQLTGVSIDTVRRDLEALESKYMLKRVHGGVILEENSVTKYSFRNREIKNKAEKTELAAKVVEYIREGQSIALNSGTTNIEVAKKIAEHFETLTIITNSLKIVEMISHKSNFKIILPGGILNNEEGSLHGCQCEASLAQYNIDVAILAVNAVSLEKGIMDFRFEEMNIIKAMMNSAGKSILAVDSSKLESVSLINVCSLKNIDMIITDSKVNSGILDKYRDNGILIETAGQPCSSDK